MRVSHFSQLAWQLVSMLPFHQIGQRDLFKQGQKPLFCQNQNFAHGAKLRGISDTGFLVRGAKRQMVWTLNRLEHFLQGDLAGVFGQGKSSAYAAMGPDHAIPGQRLKYLGQEFFRNVFALRDFRQRHHAETVSFGQVQHSENAILFGLRELHISLSSRAPPVT